jgi:Coenzyme Q (ubiquinone) biosynthesis protein Coq4
VLFKKIKMKKLKQNFITNQHVPVKLPAKRKPFLLYQAIVSIRSTLLVLLTHHVALPVLKIVRKPEVFCYNRQQLLSFKEGTVGKALVTMLDANKLTLLTHYAKHDIKHILLGYNTSDKGEVCLQCFMLGNGRYTFPVISTVLFGLLLIPEHWSVFIQAYKRGRATSPISHLNWAQIVHKQTIALQQKLQLNIFYP